MKKPAFYYQGRKIEKIEKGLIGWFILFKNGYYTRIDTIGKKPRIKILFR